MPLSIRQLCKLCPIRPTVLSQILAYALPVLFAVFPSLICYLPLLKSFQRIHFKSKSCSNIVQHSGFLSSSTKYWESPLFGCLPLLIKYICSYPPHLETVPSICSQLKCVMLPRGDNFWWFSEAALKFDRKPKTILGFLMLHVKWSLMWNVTQHQLGEPSAPDCDRSFWTVCIFHCAWKLEAVGLSQSLLLRTMLHGVHLWTAVLWSSWQNMCCAYSSIKSSRKFPGGAGFLISWHLLI